MATIKKETIITFSPDELRNIIAGWVSKNEGYQMDDYEKSQIRFEVGTDPDDGQYAPTYSFKKARTIIPR